MVRTGVILATFLSAGLTAFAQGSSTDQILQVARSTWPGPQSVGIVCNYKHSQQAILAMLGAFEPGTTVHVADTRTWDHITRATQVMRDLKPDYVLVLPNDCLVWDGSFSATWVIKRMNASQIPTLATTPAALTQGAWAVAGPATGNEVMINPAFSTNPVFLVFGKPIQPGLASNRDLSAPAGVSVRVMAAF